MGTGLSCNFIMNFSGQEKPKPQFSAGSLKDGQVDTVESFAEYQFLL